MKSRRVSFKKALNDAIRAGATLTPEFRTLTASLGVPVVNLDKALELSAELEDDELIRRMRVGS